MKRAAISLVLILAGASALAQEPADGRFSFVTTEDGILRLDTATGAVALCAESEGAVACNAVTDGAAPSDGANDIAMRLTALEERVAALEERGVFLDDEAMERVSTLAEGMMRNFFNMVGEMRRDFEGENP